MVSRRVMRRRRQFALGGALVLLVLIYFAFFSGGSSPPPKTPATTHHAAAAAEHFPKHSPLNPDWTGNGKTVTLGFGGDVHFAGAVGVNLAKDPSTALGTTIPQLFSGTQLRMVNLETAVTNGICPEPQNKPYIFDAPASAVTALKSATVSVATEANDHGMDCGPQGLSQNLTIASKAGYPIIGIGNTAAQAFAPYRVTIDGQRVAIITATQVIADNLVSTWTASSTQPGVASAIDPTQLVREVQQVRRTADTVIVYVHWGTETQACPDPQQEPLAEQLIKAGADVVIGSGTHVLLGAGYLGGAYVDYGLGNLAFYDNTAPETDSGTLIVTAQGRHITGAVWRPATILNGVPQPLSGTPATTAVTSWNAARSCTNLSPTPAASITTMRSETVPFVAPAAPPPTTTTTAGSSTGGVSTTTTMPSSGGGGSGTTTSTSSTTSTTEPASTTTAPTDNAGG
ncbi:MAG TPA: CapA family protein [Acidimicrobiales bacterium]|nr:CapA family protein [Acidimicrobiales bacterium]